MIKKSAFILLLLFSACTNKVDPAKARTVVESLLNDLKNETYQNADKYYSASFNESEPLEQKIEKYKKLREAMGAIQSFELVEAKENNDNEGGGPEFMLKYNVKCARVVAEETFLVINDEGEHKIRFQNIVSKN